MGFFSSLFPNRTLSRLQHTVILVNDWEARVQKLSDDELRAASFALRDRVQNGEIFDEVLPEAFALVREAALRKLSQRHFDVQVIGGGVLHEGKVAEMLTGEGKTLVATLPAYLNALRREGVHVVTVNDYLAKRDTVWMGQVYHALGLTVSCLVHDVAYQYDPLYETSETDSERDEVGGFRVIERFLRPISRREAYQADITYGTNHEFGFDFLRDNLTLRLSDRVQRGHAYAIIDEVDSILIDEARTPLIIASPDEESSDYYRVFAKIVTQLVPEEDYTADEKLRVVTPTDSGFVKVERAAGVSNIFDPQHSRLVHFLNESLKAHVLFKRDKDYVVKNGEILIVDEFTGRILHGRRYSGGLHQAIEAKEGLNVQQENRTYAQITIQNYFRLYKKIAGMTGTAQTSAEEFHKVYGLDVVSIPPNKKVVRNDMSDVVYKTKDAKYRAIVREVKACNEKGQAVLVGTTSIHNNEVLDGYLTKAGVPHEVLNAKNNEREGAIIAQAGRLGAVTVATNMAGRGVDIVLGGNPLIESEDSSESERPDHDAMAKMRELGGLHVIGTERHEARRIDNQLRGRSGRQGDPGSTQFFLSLEDDLMRIFGGDRVKGMMETFNFPEDEPIESRLVSKVVNQAQQKVEGSNFDIRKHLLEFDDVLNKQREVVYAKRFKILDAGEKNELRPIVFETLDRYVKRFEARAAGADSGSLTSEQEEELRKARGKVDQLPEIFEPARSILISQHVVRIIDALWVDHLEYLDSLRTSVNIRAYGQHEPLVEYRREAKILFERLNEQFESMVFSSVFPLLEARLELVSAGQPEGKQMEAKKPHEIEVKKIGRNDPCYCGSGKKYKKCHGQ